MPTGSSDKVSSAEFMTKNAPKLALMTVMFTDKELAGGSCTPSPSGYALLDQTIINGIRSKS